MSCAFNNFKRSMFTINIWARNMNWIYSLLCNCRDKNNRASLSDMRYAVSTICKVIPRLRERNRKRASYEWYCEYSIRNILTVYFCLLGLYIAFYLDLSYSHILWSFVMDLAVVSLLEFLSLKWQERRWIGRFVSHIIMVNR